MFQFGVCVCVIHISACVVVFAYSLCHFLFQNVVMDLFEFRRTLRSTVGSRDHVIDVSVVKAESWLKVKLKKKDLT